MEKGHYGQYTGNARCCANHAHTKITDEKYISKLAGDMKYDKKHNSPAAKNCF